MIPTRKLSKAEAKRFAEDIDKLSDPMFDDLKAQWNKHDVIDFSQEYQSLRDKVIAVFDKASEQNDGYKIDLDVGLCLYESFNLSNGFTYVMANDDDIWRYLSCKVFPDITYIRYPKPEKEIAEAGGHINHKRFYSHTRRIWLKTLWWYIFLAWQGSVDATREVLKDFGTDTISDFIERTGQGYRVRLYRQLMRAYAGVENKSSDLFNAIQKQNLVNCRTIEPSLVIGGEEGYVIDLFEQLSIGGEVDADEGDN